MLLKCSFIVNFPCKNTSVDLTTDYVNQWGSNFWPTPLPPLLQSSLVSMGDGAAGGNSSGNGGGEASKRANTRSGLSSKKKKSPSTSQAPPLGPLLFDSSIEWWKEDKVTIQSLYSLDSLYLHHCIAFTATYLSLCSVYIYTLEQMVYHS